MIMIYLITYEGLVPRSLGGLIRVGTFEPEVSLSNPCSSEATTGSIRGQNASHGCQEMSACAIIVAGVDTHRFPGCLGSVNKFCDAMGNYLL